MQISWDKVLRETNVTARDSTVDGKRYNKTIITVNYILQAWDVIGLRTGDSHCSFCARRALWRSPIYVAKRFGARLFREFFPCCSRVPRLARNSRMRIGNGDSRRSIKMSAVCCSSIFIRYSSSRVTVSVTVKVLLLQVAGTYIYILFTDVR